MIRTVALVALSIVVIIGLVVGCAPQESAPPSEEVPPTEGETPPAAPEQEVIRWRMQCAHTESDPKVRSAYHYCEVVEQLSGGRLVIEPFPANAIVPQMSEHEAVMKGTVETGFIGFGWYQTFDPAGLLFAQWVGGLSANQLAMWFYQGEGQALAREMTQGRNEYFVAATTFDPPEVWLHVDNPISTVADLEGLKLRMGAPILVEIFNELGASAVVLGGGEVYESMQRGVLDGFEFSTPATNWDYGMQEVADYVYLSPVRAPTDVHGIWVHEELWNELDPELQAVMEAAAKAEVPVFMAEQTLASIEAIQKFRDYGSNVLPVPEEVDAELSKVANEVYEKHGLADAFFKKVLDAQRAWKEACETVGAY